MQAIELENRRNEAAVEAEQLRLQIAAREKRIATLETELRVKQATEDLLERSVERITGIGASLAALDQQMTDQGTATTARDEIVDISRPAETESARKLIVTINGEDFDYPIVNDVMTIGRGRANDIRIASHFVSRVHAKIRTNEGATIIEDAGSKNGVLVNQTRVNRRVLHDGDVVSIGGDFFLRFVDGAA
jgi:predicted component of type VI protein secretion system